MKTHKQPKDKLTVRNPEKAWSIVEDLVLDEEVLTDAEIEVELEEHGINVDECMDKIFQAAEKIARDPNRAGKVSPHVSDILSQLSQRHRSEKKACTAAEPAAQENESTFAAGAPKAKAVKNFYRNFKNASANDRQILAEGEKLLEEKARELAQKKRTPK
jgi:hypothetical protein